MEKRKRMNKVPVTLVGTEEKMRYNRFKENKIKSSINNNILLFV